MYNHEIILIKKAAKEDELGNQIPVEERTKVLCKVSSIGSNEFYNAAVSDLKPEIKFIIHDFEYEGQKEIEFEGQRYKIMRTFFGSNTSRRGRTNLEFDEIELTCEKVIANG